MSKVFRNASGIEFMEWLSDGVGMVGPYSNIHTKDIPAFIAWLQEGPPKKRWRATFTSDVRPEFMDVFPADYAGRYPQVERVLLSPDDIEEVWE